jgi:uncharacterized repeat protein (TIGR03803 family)
MYLATKFRKQFRSLAILAALGSVLAGQVAAQTFRMLHSFASNEGNRPTAGLVISSNRLYGTTSLVGWPEEVGVGTVFALNTDGTEFTNLHVFNSLVPGEGFEPHAGLSLSGDTLYGTTYWGGTGSAGTLFSLKTDGSDYATLYSFTPLKVTKSPPVRVLGNPDGASPAAAVLLNGDSLYGTTSAGGSAVYGTVFGIKGDGTGFKNLHDFGDDGGFEVNNLVVSGHTLFGVGVSSLFALNTDGTGFRNLLSFDVSGIPQAFYGSDATMGVSTIVAAGNTVYAASGGGGSFGVGAVFAINTDGTGIRTLYSFRAGNTNSSGVYTNTDGLGPTALIVAGKTLYGAMASGGTGGSGTVYQLNDDGTDFTVLYNFTPVSDAYRTNSDGASPGGLVLAGSTLYGTAATGGLFSIEGDRGHYGSCGTLFSLSVQPQLVIATAGPNLVLSWPTNFTGYNLQSTTDLGSPAWTTVPLARSVVNGQYIVTNVISGGQQFFRLSQ